MALPVTPLNAQQAFSQLQAGAAAVKSACANVSGAASVGLDAVEALLTQVQGLDAFASAVGADTALTASMVAYAQSIYPSATVQADFIASHAALQSLRAAIIADIPKDSAGHILDRTMDSSGNVSMVALTSAQLPNTIPAIAAWLATVQ